MCIVAEDDTIYRSTSAVAMQHIEDDVYSVWNRYLPSVLFFNGDGIKLLEHMRTNNRPLREFIGFKSILKKMILNNLLYSGQDDPYKNDFLRGGELLLEEIGKSIEKHYKEKLPFGSFTIFNYSCNLACPYCIANFVREKNYSCAIKKPKKEKINRLLRVLDQLFQNSVNKNDWEGRIMFNGGEILLEWDTIKTVVNYVKSKYPRARVVFDINTNATLITEEIAEFLANHKFKTIGISIDGYKEAHNKTRRYHNGRGSYDDVINGIRLLNKYLPTPVDSYQGTLVREHDLRIEKLMLMKKKYNFKRARLAVNLLGISREDSKYMADLYNKIVVKSIEKGWSIDDNYFRSYNAILNLKAKKFTFYCAGLTNFAGKILYYNLDSEMVNIPCAFVSDVQVSLDDINDDIYHPLVFQKGLNFLRRRFDTFREVCADCEIAGICRGGCIIKGIDPSNRKNESACIFQKETWRNFLIYVH